MFEKLDVDFTPGLFNLSNPATEYLLRRITHEDFKRMISVEKRGLAQILEQMNEAATDPELDQDLKDNISTGTLGIQTVISAIELLVELQPFDTDGIEEGLLLAKRGYSLITSAFETGLKDSESYLQSVKELLSGESEMIIPNY